MMGWNKSAALFAVMLLAAVTVPDARADDDEYTYWFKATQAGRLKAWWTKDAIRVSPDPFVNNDLLKDETYGPVEAPSEDINDEDEEFVKDASTQKTESKVDATTYLDFSDFLADFGGEVTWYTLLDDGLTDLDVNIDLVEWAGHLESNPLPDPNAHYLFSNGESSVFPGYAVTDGVGGLSFTGSVGVFGVSRLREGSSIPTLSERGLVAMGLLLVLTSAALLRMRVVRSRR